MATIKIGEGVSDFARQYIVDPTLHILGEHSLCKIMMRLMKTSRDKTVFIHVLQIN